MSYFSEIPYRLCSLVAIKKLSMDRKRNALHLPQNRSQSMKDQTLRVFCTYSPNLVHARGYERGIILKVVSLIHELCKVYTRSRVLTVVICAGLKNYPRARLSEQLWQEPSRQDRDGEMFQPQCFLLTDLSYMGEEQTLYQKTSKDFFRSKKNDVMNNYCDSPMRDLARSELKFNTLRQQ